MASGTRLLRTSLTQQICYVRPHCGQNHAFRRVLKRFNHTDIISARAAATATFYQGDGNEETQDSGTLSQHDITKLIHAGLLRTKQGHSLVDPIKLRVACKCPACIDRSSGQKKYSIADIPPNINVVTERYLNGPPSGLRVTWTNDVPGFHDHESIFALEDLQRSVLPNRSLQQAKALWTGKQFEHVSHTVSYDSFMNEDSGLKTALSLLHYYGLFFVNGVPSDEESVARLAERIGPIRNTFYGRTWDVKSKPKAENVAYTNQHLGFHMDLLYMHEPPGIQLLHCIENTCEGGESAFVDAFRAAQDFFSRHADDRAFTALSRDVITYGYNKGGNIFSAAKPVLDLLPVHSLDRKIFFDGGRWCNAPPVIDRLRRVYWSPPFTSADIAPGTLKHHEFGEPAYRSRIIQQYRKTFADILEEKRLRFETKLPPGTCAIFDNLRIVHARKAFDTTSGHRWLRGAYVDSQDFQSKVQAIGLDPRNDSELGVHGTMNVKSKTKLRFVKTRQKEVGDSLKSPTGQSLIRKHWYAPVSSDRSSDVNNVQSTSDEVVWSNSNEDNSGDMAQNTSNAKESKT
jgi:hypothetical protein